MNNSTLHNVQICEVFARVGFPSGIGCGGRSTAPEGFGTILGWDQASYRISRTIDGRAAHLIFNTAIVKHHRRLNNNYQPGIGMVTYILLVTLTEFGRANFKTSWTTTRDEFKKKVKSLGGNMTGYVTAGPYDAVEIIDVPQDDAALPLLLGSLSVKEIRTVTLKGFHEDQVRKTLEQM